MVFVLFLVGVLAGMATATFVWVGISSALVLVGFAILILLCAVLSSAVASVLGTPADSGTSSDEGVRTERAR